MITFQVDMESEALRILARLADPPLKPMHRILAKKAEVMVQASYDGRHAPRRGSLYQGIKKALVGENAKPGTLTGATEAGITGIVEFLGAMHTAAKVVLMGKWPKPGTNKQAHIPLSTIAALGDSSETGVDIENLGRGGSFVPSGPGAFVSLTAGGGLNIVWDKALKDSGEIKDWHVPSQRLETKVYGEFIDYPEDFMYLSNRQVNELVETVDNMVGNLLGMYGGNFGEDWGRELADLEARQANFARKQQVAMQPTQRSIPSTQETVISEFKESMGRITDLFNFREYARGVVDDLILKYGVDAVTKAQKEIAEMVRRGSV